MNQFQTYRWTLEKLENVSTGALYILPRYEFEVQVSQAPRNRYEQPIGSDYPFDVFRQSRAPADKATITVRLEMVEDTILDLNNALQSMKAFVRNAGLLKLWSIRDTNTRRWCYARASRYFDVTLQANQILSAPVVFSFDQISDWFDATQYDQTFHAAATPFAFTVTNPGDIACTLMQVKFISKGAAGFHAPEIDNLSNNYQFKSLRNATSINDIVRMDTNTGALEYSQDGGLTYIADYANRVIGGSQALWMLLQPGDNAMRYIDAGAPNVDIEVVFYPPYA